MYKKLPLKSIFPLSNNHYNLRSESVFKSVNIRIVHYGSETISFTGPKIWELIPYDMKKKYQVLDTVMESM